MNRLTFLEHAGHDKYSHPLIKCICKCGNIIITLKYDKAKACGHCNLSKKFPGEYISYNSMLQRCYNKNRKREYKYYGEREITVCQRWKEDFFNFFEDMGPRPKGTTLDRKNSDDNYYKENCRWATNFIQQNNRRKRKTKSLKVENAT